MANCRPARAAEVALPDDEVAAVGAAVEVEVGGERPAGGLILERADIDPRPGHARKRRPPLIKLRHAGDAGNERPIPRINRGTPRQQSVREGRPAIIGQRPQQRINHPMHRPADEIAVSIGRTDGGFGKGGSSI